MRSLIIGLVISITLVGGQPSGNAQDNSPHDRILVTDLGTVKFVDPITHEADNLPHDIPVAYWASPSWSPDQQYIAYESEFRDDVEIHTINLETLEVSRLTRGNISILPRWSPDGLKIAYVAADEEGPALYLMNVDGANKRLLFRLDQARSRIFYSWSPDSQSLVFRDNYDTQLSILTMTDNGEVEITPLAEDLHLCGEGLISFGSVSWSRATGDIAVFVRCPQISLVLLDMEFDNGYYIEDTTQLLDDTWQEFGVIASDGLDWSEDGTQLVFFTDIEQFGDSYRMMLRFNVATFLTTGEVKIALVSIARGAYGFGNPAWQS